MKVLTAVVLCLGSFSSVACSIAGNEVSTCSLPQIIKDEIASYGDVTNKIIKYFVDGPYKGKTWKSLATFVDRFGPRMSGSPELERSIDYIVQLLKKSNVDDVYTEDVVVPYWKRGKETGELLLPRRKELPILGLGFSVATPKGGIEANAVVVSSFEELKALSNDQVKGKIVVYAQPFINYPTSVEYRVRGASEAAIKGAVGALVRSVTPFSLNTLHTGIQNYYKNVTKIPVASITVEDALLLLRLYKRKAPIRIKFSMENSQESRISRNTIAELRGREIIEKVVIVSGHIDSWDVGQGAVDDGGGAFISWTVPVVLETLNLRPRRTLRAILWTGEEVGDYVIGSTAYEKAHRDENKNLNFVMESDSGTFDPLGLSYTGSAQGKCIVREIAKLFASINATNIDIGDAVPDLEPFIAQNVPAGGLKNANSKYFWYHHTSADRVSAVDPDALDKCAAYWTAFSYVVADLSFDIPRER